MSTATATSISSPAARTARRRCSGSSSRRPTSGRGTSLGTKHPSDVGGTAFDVDGDGWVDHVTGGVWYRNTGKPRDGAVRAHRLRRRDWPPCTTSSPPTSTATAARDIVTMSDKNNLRWYRIPADPRQPWERHDIGPGVHAGVAVGDIDGDGDPDIARSNAWFENADGKGTTWVEHPVPFGNPRRLSARDALRHRGHRPRRPQRPRDDRKRDPRRQNRLAGKRRRQRHASGKCTSCPPAIRRRAARITPWPWRISTTTAIWTSSRSRWRRSPARVRRAGSSGRTWTAKARSFVERVILDNGLGGHEAVVADVDGDGDLDICSKLWRPRKDNANDGRNHADFLENRRIVRAE